MEEDDVCETSPGKPLLQFRVKRRLLAYARERTLRSVCRTCGHSVPACGRFGREVIFCAAAALDESNRKSGVRPRGQIRCDSRAHDVKTFAWTWLSAITAIAIVHLLWLSRWVDRDAARFEALRRELQ